MKMRRCGRVFAASVAALAVSSSARAHHAMDSALPGNFVQGLASGLAHPVIGLDHFLFVIALGAACYCFGRRAGTVALFTGGTLAGTGLHLHQATIAYPDVWVALSLLLLGTLFLGGRGFLKSHGALVFFGLAGIAHGYAYGESIVGAEPTPLIAYLAGFTMVQFAIALAGYAAARYLDRAKPAFRGTRALGGVLSLAGVAFLALSLT